MKELSQAQKDLIGKPLPSEAVTQHPTKTYLSSIKAIYVTERLNEVFGFWGWTIKVKKEEHGEKGMIVVHVTFEVPEYWFYYECFWWNDNGGETSKNFDLWDAYKWATTDAITKIASWIGIWAEVFKGKQKWGNKPQPKETPTGETIPDDDNKEWFNEENWEKFKLVDHKFSNPSEAPIKARKYYKVSKIWASKIEDYYKTWEDNSLESYK